MGLKTDCGISSLVEPGRDEGEMAIIATKEKRANEQPSFPSQECATRLRCLCGKWWSYQAGDEVVLRCKLCRREIVIRGENLTIEYR